MALGMMILCLLAATIVGLIQSANNIDRKDLDYKYNVIADYPRYLRDNAGKNKKDIMSKDEWYESYKIIDKMINDYNNTNYTREGEYIMIPSTIDDVYALGDILNECRKYDEIKRKIKSIDAKFNAKIKDNKDKYYSEKNLLLDKTTYFKINENEYFTKYRNMEEELEKIESEYHDEYNRLSDELEDELEKVNLECLNARKKVEELKKINVDYYEKRLCTQRRKHYMGGYWNLDAFDSFKHSQNKRDIEIGREPLPDNMFYVPSFYHKKYAHLDGWDLEIQPLIDYLEAKGIRYDMNVINEKIGKAESEFNQRWLKKEQEEEEKKKRNKLGC